MCSPHSLVFANLMSIMPVFLNRLDWAHRRDMKMGKRDRDRGHETSKRRINSRTRNQFAFRNLPVFRKVPSLSCNTGLKRLSEVTQGYFLCTEMAGKPKCVY
jgi:hypothetical protein